MQAFQKPLPKVSLNMRQKGWHEISRVDSSGPLEFNFYFRTTKLITLCSFEVHDCRGQEFGICLSCSLNVHPPPAYQGEISQSWELQTVLPPPGFLSRHLLCQGRRWGQSGVRPGCQSPGVMRGRERRAGAGGSVGAGRQHDGRQPGSKPRACWPRRGECRAWQLLAA